MKKSIILSLIVMISLFFYRSVSAAEVGIPTTFTEISDLRDLPEVVTRPVATSSEVFFYRTSDQNGPTATVLYFYDLEENGYKFDMRVTFQDELLQLAKDAFIAEKGTTPAYFKYKPQDEQDPYRLYWGMEYYNGIAITFKFLTYNASQQPEEYYDYTYTVKNSDHISGGWTKTSEFSYSNTMPSTTGDFSFKIPTGKVMEYSKDGITYERVPEYNQTNNFYQAKLSISKTGTQLYASFVYYRQNKYNENLMDTKYVELEEYNPNTFKFRYYSLDSISEITVGNTNTVSQLPETTGNILGKQGSMGTVHFVQEGTNLLTTISYGGLTYNILNSFESTTDMTVFDNSYEIYYYTSLNEKFIIINHGQESIFTVENILESPFIPFTVWNLSTNESKTFKKYNVYMYSKKEAANNVFAYFYVDNYIVDNLVSATVSMKYHYTYITGSGEEQYYYKVLEADESNYGGGLTWQYNLLVGSTFGALGILGNRYLMPLVGSVLFKNVQNKNFNFGSINEIEELVPSLELTTELNAAYRSKYPDFNNVNNNLKVFKLHLGQFNKPFSVGIKIDEEFNYIGNQKGINVIEFTYITNGQFYTVKGEDINIFFVPDKGTSMDPPITIPSAQTIWDNIIEFLKKAYLIVVVAVWGYTVRYIYPPFEAITGKRVKGLPRLLVAVGYFGIVYMAIKWFITFSG